LHANLLEVDADRDGLGAGDVFFQFQPLRETSIAPPWSGMKTEDSVGSRNLGTPLIAPFQSELWR